MNPPVKGLVWSVYFHFSLSQDSRLTIRGPLHDMKPVSSDNNDIIGTTGMSKQRLYKRGGAEITNSTGLAYVLHLYRVFADCAVTSCECDSATA